MAKLTALEHEVRGALLDGWSIREIADELGFSVARVYGIIGSIRKKLRRDDLLDGITPLTVYDLDAAPWDEEGA